jgi:acyl-CoA synthetase (AMP-forming)/AMP-acid ligase II
MVSHRAVLASVADFNAALGLGSHDVFASMLPMCDHMGLMCFGLAPLLSGRPLVLYRSEVGNLQAWLTGLCKYGVTVTGATDLLLQTANRLVEEPVRYDLRRLRMLLCGAEPVCSGSVETFGSRFNVLHAIKPMYGLAELTSCVTVTPGHEPARVDELGHVACGRPLCGVDVCIAGEDGVRTREPGVWGEVRVRSRAAMNGYWMRPRESANAIDDLGYLRTGDLGYLDAQGCLYVLGRMDSLFVHGASKHALHDVEAAANELLGIGRVAVVRSERDHSRLIAVLEVARALLQDKAMLQQLSRCYEFAARARTGIAPSDCWFIPVGSLPCTENGKPRHAWLRAQIDRGRFVPAWACVSATAAGGLA